MLIKNIKSKKEMLKQVQHDVAAVIAGLTRNPFKRTMKVLLFAAFLGFTSCGDWLDVVPEGIATIDMAFNSREQSLKYLGTCYSQMYQNGNVNYDPAMLGGDEMWTFIREYSACFGYTGFYLAQGMQSAAEPLFDFWGPFYQVLRDCNIFLENVGSVPDLPEWERDQWIAEVKVLKAYYHFMLMQIYGPVPLIRENIPVDVDASKVRVLREPVDDCVQYMVELIDEATRGELLPLNVLDVAGELGRITKPIALSLKAKILVVAASPLFNGNSDYATLRNRDGTPLFNATYEEAKWQKAALACREAIETCHEAGIELYEYPNTGIIRLTDTIATQMSLRNAFTQRWNSEIVWANTQSLCTGGFNGMQQFALPVLNLAISGTSIPYKELGIPLKIAAMFYSHHGVPLAEDKTRDVNELYSLRTARAEEKLYVKSGSVSLDLHFDREPRFYAWVGFDQGIWYGQGRTNDKDELFTLGLKADDHDKYIWGTGYLPKKHLPYTNVLSSINSYSYTPFPWPIMRLSDLYLLYAEAINEAEGPNGANSSEMFEYVDRVRKRAGLEGVKHSWDTYTNNPKYNNPTGMRDIIRQERLNELAFEGHRFWDIRRWKTAPDVYRTPIEGWNFKEATPATFYTRQTLYFQKFGLRDYFWPIKNSDIVNNPNLVQNIGW